VSTALVARLTRTTMLEVNQADDMRAARAKGLSERRVVFRHGLRNALIPVVTLVGLNLADLIGSAILTETVFNWPGMGSAIADAITQRDAAIISVLGPGERTVILVLGLLGWLAIARVLRSSMLHVTSLEYVTAARALGASGPRILLRHVLPNAIQPVIVYATLFVGSAILSEAALSFLGLGIQEPTPAWGLMVNQRRRFLATSPHLLFFPGAAIFVIVTAFVFVGDGLRDALDLRLQ